MQLRRCPQVQPLCRSDAGRAAPVGRLSGVETPDCGEPAADRFGRQTLVASILLGCPNMSSINHGRCPTKWQRGSVTSHAVVSKGAVMNRGCDCVGGAGVVRPCIDWANDVVPLP